jgi:hypothetical protein
VELTTTPTPEIPLTADTDPSKSDKKSDVPKDIVHLVPLNATNVKELLTTVPSVLVEESTLLNVPAQKDNTVMLITSAKTVPSNAKLVLLMKIVLNVLIA